MRRFKTQLAYGLALAGGAALWLVTMLISGRREAWDSPLYWQVAYPLSIALAAWFACRAPDRPWRWALAVMLIQPVVMAVTSGSSFGLLPLGLILFGLLAVPAVLVTLLVARWTKRRRMN
jgi:hypothetical protein